MVADDETLVRALLPPFWDERLKRASRSAFVGSEVSVSRPKILPYEQIIEIFKHDLNRAVDDSGGAGRMVGATATVLHKQVLEACDDTPPPLCFVDVIADPVTASKGIMQNDSHALIRGRDRSDLSVPRKLTHGMANRILKHCSIREVF